MKKIFLSFVLLSLAACQPDTPTQQPKPQPEVAPTPTVVTPAVVTPQPAQSMMEAKPVAVTGDSAMLDLAKKSGCLTCHAIDKTMLGPAWNKVAAKYRGQPDAEATLTAKVAKGGSGVWGKVAMPPNSPRLKEGDIRELVRFILALE